MKEYYIAEPGKAPHGPYDEAMVKRAFENNMYPKGTMVWYEGAATWEPIEKLIAPQHVSMPPLPSLTTPPPLPTQETVLNVWNPITAFVSCMKRYVQFSGRASRSEFWLFQLSYFIIILTSAQIVGGLSGDEDIAGIVMLIFALPFIVPSLSVQARRLHDMGRSAWWLLLLLLLYLGKIILLIMSCFPGKNENNPYGSAPLPPV